jgi:pimeloyl-ACP methyl ester carboxylesterase
MRGAAASLCRIVVISVSLVCAQCSQGLSSDDRFLDSDGVAIRYRVSGTGPPVILIHGFGETLERWHSTGVIRILSPHFRVITFDVRGHGRSGKPRGLESYGRELAGDVVRLIGDIGAAKAHVVGYSMGALVALDVAVLHPNHVLSVVLGGAGLNTPETRAEFERQADAFEQGKVEIRNGQDAGALAALLRGLALLSEEEVRRITIPMAVVIGANDGFMPNVHRLARVRPSTAVVVIPDANHATAIDRPEFARALIDILSKYTPQ